VPPALPGVAGILDGIANDLEGNVSELEIRPEH
jgi:hypothetical protein